MTHKMPVLERKSIAVLEQIAAGHTYEQIVSLHPDLTYLDIFAAARAALTILGVERQDYAARLKRIKLRHPRAYERWTEDEDVSLARLVKGGAPVITIAQKLHRQPSAIRSRLAKLGLTDEP